MREIVPTVEEEEEMPGAEAFVEIGGVHEAAPVVEMPVPVSRLETLKASPANRRPLRSIAAAPPDLTPAESDVLNPVPVPETIPAPTFERPPPPRVGPKDYLTKPFSEWTMQDYEYLAADETAANIERQRQEEAKMMSPEVTTAIDTGVIDQVTAAQLLMQMAAPQSSQPSFVSASGISRLARLPKRPQSVSPQIQSVLQAAPIDDDNASVMSDVTMQSPFVPGEDDGSTVAALGGGRRKGPTLHEIKSYDDFMAANLEV